MHGSQHLQSRSCFGFQYLPYSHHRYIHLDLDQHYYLLHQHPAAAAANLASSYSIRLQVRPWRVPYSAVATNFHPFLGLVNLYWMESWYYLVFDFAVLSVGVPNYAAVDAVVVGNSVDPLNYIHLVYVSSAGSPNDDVVVDPLDCIPYSSSSVVMSPLDALTALFRTIYYPSVASYDGVVDNQNPFPHYRHSSDDESCASGQLHSSHHTTSGYAVVASCGRSAADV